MDTSNHCVFYHASSLIDLHSLTGTVRIHKIVSFFSAGGDGGGSGLPGPLLTKAPFTQGCDLRATFERPENWPGRSVVAQTQKVLFCVPAAARPLCVPWTTTTAVVAQQVVQRRQSGGRTIAVVAQGMSWSPNGGTVVATVITQWTLWSAKGGTMVVQARQKHPSNWYTMFTTTRIFNGRPI